jgi:hypothetical protein
MTSVLIEVSMVNARRADCGSPVLQGRSVNGVRIVNADINRICGKYGKSQDEQVKEIGLCGLW